MRQAPQSTSLWRFTARASSYCVLSCSRNTIDDSNRTKAACTINETGRSEFALRNLNKGSLPKQVLDFGAGKTIVQQNLGCVTSRCGIPSRSRAWGAAELWRWCWLQSTSLARSGGETAAGHIVRVSRCLHVIQHGHCTSIGAIENLCPLVPCLRREDGGEACFHPRPSGPVVLCRQALLLVKIKALQQHFVELRFDRLDRHVLLGPGFLRVFLAEVGLTEV
mmetsp:Transcript_4934/g.11743  ORF Transcript_4934/g.11743 Transcript_4934/m.11743 type:complete len:222 (-) Transcript_4934:40-705(-)